MKHRPLGRTGLTVSEICLGTMTWGSQNDEAEAHRQMDYALDEGVTFFDTAEMYPTTPLARETVGRTEELVGSWFAARGRRDEVVLATKITGEGSPIVRDGAPITPAAVVAACEASLQRLRTDRIDLYQLHWPNRGSYHFRKSWSFNPSGRDVPAARADIEAVLEALSGLVKAGKVRHVGLSNETAWGTMEFLRIAEAKGLPRVASIQNEYNLLCRYFDLDLAEVAIHEDVGLLAYSPLAAGLLSAKYSGGAVPAGSRASIRADLGGRMTPGAREAADDFAGLARSHGLEPAQMALAFCLSRPFMTSVIVGATSMEQLRLAIGSAELRLSDEVLDGIAALHRRWPLPF